MSETIRAPFTAEQVDALNRYQSHGNPFTCVNDHGGVNVVMIARTDGWHCSEPSCDSRQYMAYAFMADPDAWPKPWPRPSCPDPIECGHEAALGQAKAALARVGVLADELFLAGKTETERGTGHRLLAALDEPAPAAGPAATPAADPAARYAQAVQRVQSSGPKPAPTEPCVGRLCAGTSCSHEQAFSDLVHHDQAAGLYPDTPPDTITDPAYLREQYAAAIWERQNPGRRWADCEYRWRADAEADAAAVLRVRDRHLEQLRQRLKLADTELQQWAAAESADAAAGSYAGRAEQQRDQYAGILREILDELVPGTVSGRTAFYMAEQPFAPWRVDHWRAAVNQGQEQPNA